MNEPKKYARAVSVHLPVKTQIMLDEIQDKIKASRSSVITTAILKFYIDLKSRDHLE
jgi:hypothetical protein